MRVHRAVSCGAAAGAAAAAALLTLAIVATPRAAAAQSPMLELHANYSEGTTSHTKSWGAGTQVQMTVGSPVAAINLGTSLGFDYLKAERGGPAQLNVSYDATLQPGGGGTLVPYAGGSAGANWSTGDRAQWKGARLGTEAVGGVQVKVGKSVTTKVEERFGYVRGQEHALTTRLGVSFSI